MGRKAEQEFKQNSNVRGELRIKVEHASVDYSKVQIEMAEMKAKIDNGPLIQVPHPLWLAVELVSMMHLGRYLKVPDAKTIQKCLWMWAISTTTLPRNTDDTLPPEIILITPPRPITFSRNKKWSRSTNRARFCVRKQCADWRRDPIRSK